MRTTPVDLPAAGYEILVGDALLAAPAVVDALRPIVGERACFVVSDTHVAPLYLEAVCQALTSANAARVASHTIRAGEASKTLQTLGELYQAGIAAGLDRSSVILALGGGVVGDVAGFFAATYMRGVPYVQVPTSLLAMVDSSVGGKTAVDLPEGKNLVGAFHQPVLVLADTACLRSLPARELRCGLAEVIKYGVIMDEQFFSELEQDTDALTGLDVQVYERVISHCCRLKARIVEEDEREQGRRAILNYGHTFGHALEMLGGFAHLNHGEAVAVGMAMAADLAQALGMAAPAVGARQNALLETCGLPTRWRPDAQIPPDAVLAAMFRDKKAVGGALRLILPRRIGYVGIVSNPGETAVLEAIGGRLDHA